MSEDISLSESKMCANKADITNLGR